MVDGCMIVDCNEWQWWCLVRSCERVIEWIWWTEWMNEWMHAWTECCLCVCFCMCICGWVVRSTCLQGGAVYIWGSGSSGTFTNCNFTSNEASVSLEEKHVDGCEMSKCMTLRLCPPCICLLDWLILTSSIDLLWLFPVIGDRSWSHLFFCFGPVVLCLCVYTCRG